MHYTQAINHYLEQVRQHKIYLKAVLFDMDGVIYDSMPNHALCWHLAMKKHGMDLPVEEAYLYEGMRGVETIQIISQRQLGKVLTEEEAAPIYEEKARLFEKRPEAKIMPGIITLMKQIKSAGLQIVVVTGSGQKPLLQRLSQDLKEFITPDKIVSAFDVTQGKPNPDPYLKGLRKAGNIQPYEAIVIENAPFGVQAGVAAQIFTIAVNTGPLPEKVLTEKGAHLIFPSIQCLSDSFADLRQALDQNIR